MIAITSNANRVEVKFKTGLYNNTDVHAFIECGNPMFAELLANRLREKLEKTIEEVRKLEYNDGVRDGRAKAKKRDYFWDNLSTNKY